MRNAVAILQNANRNKPACL